MSLFLGAPSKSLIILNMLCFLMLREAIATPSSKPTTNSVTTTYKFNALQITALHSLYNSTQGYNWAVQRGWNFTGNSNPCIDFWHGVHCSYTDNCSKNSTQTQKTCVLTISKLELSGNNLNGYLPSEIQFLSGLQYLDISKNQLKERLPAQIFHLTNLQVLYGNNNIFTGTIPSGIFNYTNMTTLDLSWNRFEGSLPSTIGILTRLITLKVGSNEFSGPIPSSIGNLTNLVLLELFGNRITGKIPTEIRYLTSLEVLKLHDNLLNHKIPSEIQHLKHLRQLNMSSNELTGTLPQNISRLSNLEYLHVNSNRLSGSIPSSFSNLTNLVDLQLKSNRLVGTIPVIYSAQTMILSSNSLTNRIPIAIGQMFNLQFLDLSLNEITGFIPSSISNLRYLKFLSVANNYITGTLPTEIYALSSLQTLNLNSNKLQGTIFDNFTHFQNLTVLDVSHNLFDGFFPSTLGSLKQLQYLIMGSNYLEGTIPDQYKQLSSLKALDVSKNYLVGSLSQLFNASIQKSLRVVDFSNNRLTGGLPDELFRLSSIQIISGGLNCFSDNIPSQICYAQKLEKLLLDGLNSKCLGYVQTFMKSPQTLQNCILQLPLLNTLHLSGNFMSGSFPSSSFSIGTRLQVLTLSHNIFTGDIPSYICSHPWKILDLGFNKFSGELCTNINVESSLYFQVNRLSGSIPTVYQNITDIALVEGNIFDCDTSGSDLPPNDASSSTYECGTDSTDLSFYVFLFFILFAVFGFSLKYALTSGHIEDSNKPKQKLDGLQFEVIWRMMFVFIVGIMVASSIHSCCSTYSVLYAWYVSFGFLRGIDSALAMIAYVVVFGLSEFSSYRHQVAANNKNDQDEDYSNNFAMKKQESVLGPQYQRILIGFLAFTASSINVAVTLLYNLYYSLYATKLAGAQLIVIQVAAAIFKMIYPVIPLMVNYAASRWTKDRSLQRRIDMVVGVQRQFFLNFFSIVIAPVIATSVANIDCFYNLVFSAPAVTSSYFQSTNVSTTFDHTIYWSTTNASGTYYYTYLTTETFAVNIGSTNSFSPSYIYSYQCASAIMSSYVVVFVYYAVFTGFVYPVIRLIIRWYQVHAYSEEGSTGCVYDFTNFIIPNALSSKCDPEDVVVRSFDSRGVSVQLKIMIMITLTFGMVYPPVGIAMLIAIVSKNFITLIEIEYFFNHAHPAVKDQLEVVIRQEVKTFFKTFKLSVWFKIVASTAFMCLFIFDALGDSNGWVIATITSILVLFILPIIIYFIFNFMNMLLPTFIGGGSQLQLRNSKPINLEEEPVTHEMNYYLFPNSKRNINGETSNQVSKCFPRTPTASESKDDQVVYEGQL